MATAPSPSCPRNAAPAPSAPLYDTMVTIKVGRQKQAFFAHKGLICNYSTYFKAAFHGQFREATAGAVELDNDDVEVFKTFFGWMYTGKLFEPSSEPGKVPLTANLLAKIYVFGDARGIPDLKNAAIDAFVDKIIDDWNNVPASTIPYIYDNTPEDSKLRKLLVDMITYETLASGFTAFLRHVQGGVGTRGAT
ncbi:hypothetical protein W97_06458 [Coniosporium apollinis CBS 100218]|uniref:BTB domain-containing protein n=1 Tax=Coniosporium apollinis (strain CBS 100218) TaxID=1168221 RepID=R7YZ29_CONA1|nr:uncharacterized protein W97_06458 [Coniosporium apollinis CBS 100218]EON67205.1 hypothetical protein W97_06458 [Coniosporium apollinis CBS 100218]